MRSCPDTDIDPNHLLHYQPSHSIFSVELFIEELYLLTIKINLFNRLYLLQKRLNWSNTSL